MEKKAHLEEALTALVLTTGINSQQAVSNTGIFSLLAATKASILSIVSTAHNTCTCTYPEAAHIEMSSLFQP